MRRFEVPGSYDEWRYCITVKCGLDLTAEFIEQRLAALADAGDDDTRRFVELYGEDYRALVVEWFERARDEAGSRRFG